MSLQQFLALIGLTLRRPDLAAPVVTALFARPGARGMALGAVMAGSALLGALAEAMFTMVTGLDLGQGLSPFAVALMQGAAILYFGFAMSFFGRQLGGQGQFGDALSLMIWVEVMLIAGQAVQLVVMVFFPMAAVMLSLALLGLMFWLTVRFTAVLHGFDNLFFVGAGVLLVFIGSAMVLGALAMALGIELPFMVSAGAGE